MAESESIIIPFSNKKLIKLLAVSVAFVVAGCWLLIAQPEMHNSVFSDSFTRNTAAIVCVLFFGFASIALTLKIRAKKPALVIDETGITNNTGTIGGDHIPWSGIRAIVTNTVFNQVFLMVILYEPEAYINKQKGFLKRKAMLHNYKKYGAPVSISANTLQMSLSELRQLLHDKLSRYNDVKR